MKQTLLLMMLALGLCSINVRAQKNYKVETDGFEWYEISDNGKKGAIDKYGNLIVPVVYSSVEYILYKYFPDDSGYFRCKICENADNYFEPGIFVIYNRRGQVLFKSQNKYSYISLDYHNPVKKYCLHVCKTIGTQSRYGIISKKEEEIVPCIYEDISGSLTYPIEVKQGGEWKKLPVEKMSVVLVGKDFLKNNKPYSESIPSLTWTNNNSSSSLISSSSTSSGSNSGKSNSGTTTVVVEHHHDPVPVQVWIQCNICYGSGICQTINCNNGWNYGTRMACLGCGGSGRCGICGGHGGHYEVQYR